MIEFLDLVGAWLAAPADVGVARPSFIYLRLYFFADFFEPPFFNTRDIVSPISAGLWTV
jgi:hypothetical protein